MRYDSFGDLLLPDMNPVVKDGVRASAGREHEDGFENTRQDGTAREIRWLEAAAEMGLNSPNLHVSQVENANDIQPYPKLHLEVPDDGNGQSTENYIGEDITGWIAPASARHGLVGMDS